MTVRPPQFGESAGSWNTYKVRLEAYFEGHSIEEPKRRALLVAALGDNVVKVLLGRCHPKKVNELSYEDVVKHLEEYYARQVNEVAASYNFFMRNQEDGESVQAFVAEARRLAEDCNFGKILHRMTRDRLVCGLLDDDVRRHLLTRRTLTLEEAEDFAIASDRAAESTRRMKKQEVSVGEGAHLVQSGRYPINRPKPGNKTGDSRGPCGRCGHEFHLSQDCTHRRATCFKCANRGHLARACWGAKKKPRNTNALDEDYASDHDEPETPVTLVAHKSSSTGTVRPIHKTMAWNNVPLMMLIDTGSPVSVIPRDVCEKHKSEWPTLKKTVLRLSCYLGPISIAGNIEMTVKFGRQAVAGSLTVANCTGPILCGRDTIKALNQLGVPVLSSGNTLVNFLVAEAAEPKPDTLNILLDNFADVFEPTLGLCKRPPVHLNIKDGATPRFFKARTMPYALREKVSNEVDRLVKEGVLSSVTVSDWATPVAPVVKKNGDNRLCGDFKLTVNAATKTEQYPLPKVEDIFAALNGGDVFSTLALRNAYNQLVLDEESRKMTVLNIHKGMFCFNRLPIGIASAPVIFQRRIESPLNDLPGVQVHLDDIIVAEVCTPQETTCQQCPRRQGQLL